MKKTKNLRGRNIRKYMSIEEFISLVKNRPYTEVDIEAYRQRVIEREKLFVEWERKSRPTKEFMDRQYTI